MCVKNTQSGSGCGSVGRVVASDTRGPRFESAHQKTFYYLSSVNCIEKTNIKKKGPGMGHLKIQNKSTY